jgi:hypothetical protein
MQTYKALEIWTAQTLCNIGILLSLVSFLLHIGRPYFERILARLPLRVAADFWWLLYIIFRDGTLLLAVIIGLFTLNPDLMADIKIGLPFVPLATVALAAALAVKVFNNAEDVNRSFRLVTFLVTLGLLSNTIGFVLIMEAPGDEYNLGKLAFWQTMRSWRSNANPNLSLVTFYISTVLLSVIALYCFVKAIKIFGKAPKSDRSDSQIDKLTPSYPVMEK